MSNGEEMSLSFSATDTVLALKKRLHGLCLSKGKSVPPCSAMRLVSGIEVLFDESLVADHRIKDGDQLSLIVSSAPLGDFHYNSRDQPGDYGDPWYQVVIASFSEDSGFRLEVIDLDDDDGDDHVQWRHLYTGTVQLLEGSRFQLTVKSGVLSPVPGMTGILDGEMTEDELRLQVPSSREGEALRWLSFTRSEPGTTWDFDDCD